MFSGGSNERNSDQDHKQAFGGGRLPVVWQDLFLAGRSGLTSLVHHGQQEHPGFTAAGACLQHHVVPANK